MARIMIVEDDRHSALIVERMLTRIGGHEVRIVDSPDEVIERLGRGEVELIITDVSLSGSTYRGEKVDGLQLSKIIKSDDKLPHVPIILLTAHAMRGDRERFLERSQADAYLTKPILDYRSFCDLIQRLLLSAAPLGAASDSSAPEPRTTPIPDAN